MTVAKAIKLTVRWMPSHLLDNDPLPDGITRCDVLSNRHADHYAKIRAQRLQVPLNVSTPVIFYYSLVRKIQRRLVNIIYLYIYIYI